MASKNIFAIGLLVCCNSVQLHLHEASKEARLVLRKESNMSFGSFFGSPQVSPFLESAVRAKTNLSYKVLPARIWRSEQLRFSQHFHSFLFPGPLLRPEPFKTSPTLRAKLSKFSLSMGFMLNKTNEKCFYK